MRISDNKKDKISEQILAFLYFKNPQAIFTSHIANEIARDEEFIKKLLFNLKNKKLLVEIKKNPKGNFYLRRSRWKLSDQTYLKYKQINDD